MASAGSITKEEEAQIQQALAHLRAARKAAGESDAAAASAASPTRAATTAGAPLEKTMPVALLPETERPEWAPRPKPVGKALEPAPAVAAAAPASVAPVTIASRPDTPAAPMSPELQARIALLLEQEAEEREQRRAKQQKLKYVAGGVGALIVFAIFIATSLGGPAQKQHKAPPAAAAAERIH